MTNTKYFHDEEHHNLYDPSIIVPVLIDLINPKSVLDIGCGIGTFLKILQEHQINDITGIDGEWVNYELLKKNIDLDNFKVFDLEKEFNLNRKYDLVISLEVGEHIHENCSDIFLDNLVKHSDIIVFSAAFPEQGGQNHYNEQWPEYWIEKFANRGYEVLDYLRPTFWKIVKLAPWYKQNMFLFVKKKEKHLIKNKANELLPLYQTIHPDYYNSLLKKNQEYEKIVHDNYSINKGMKSILYYVKLLIKAILRRIKLYNK